MQIVSEITPIKCYVKYDREYPYLPIAIADTKAELARILGKNESTVYSAFSRNQRTYAEVEYYPDIYPDNDGGCWYHDPITGEVVLVKD